MQSLHERFWQVGWGIFRERIREKGERRKQDWVGSFVYVLLFVLPTVLLSTSFLSSVSYVEVSIFACLLAVTVYSLTTLFKRSTANKKF